MNKVSESIFSGKTTVIPMADVQHVEKNRQSCDYADGSKKGDISGYTIITRHSRWDAETDSWANPIILGKEEGEAFLRAWRDYRHELEDGAEAFNGPE